MRSRSRKVGAVYGSREGSHEVNYQRWVQTYPCGKDSEENITLHMLSSPSWEFLKLINPRHDSSPSEQGTLFHSERGVSDNTLKRHGHLAVKTFFPPLVLWPIVSEEREVSFKSFHKLIINSSLYSFYCHLFRTHTPAFTVTNPPSLPKTYQITSVIFKILIGTITRGNTVADMGNHGRKANVNLLLGLERFARAHWETPKTKKKLWKPHCDRQWKPAGK